MELPQIKHTKEDATRYWQESESFFEAVVGVFDSGGPGGRHGEAHTPLDLLLSDDPHLDISHLAGD
jgi:hypothetical protein